MRMHLTGINVFIILHFWSCSWSREKFHQNPEMEFVVVVEIFDWGNHQIAVISGLILNPSTSTQIYQVNVYLLWKFCLSVVYSLPCQSLSFVFAHCGVFSHFCTIFALQSAEGGDSVWKNVQKWKPVIPGPLWDLKQIKLH